MNNILFLGYDREKTRLIDLIDELGWAVEQTEEKVDDLSNFDLAISFGYRHIIPAHVLRSARRPVLNLHIAYLPWNRGAHPLFWAAHDDAPIGVTIHEIDEGIDTGPICFQKKVHMDLSSETFASGYKILTDEIENLFEVNALDLLAGNYVATPQVGRGTFKRTDQLPSGFSWTDTIAPTISKLSPEWVRS